MSVFFIRMLFRFQKVFLSPGGRFLLLKDTQSEQEQCPSQSRQNKINQPDRSSHCIYSHSVTTIQTKEQQTIFPSQAKFQYRDCWPDRKTKKKNRNNPETMPPSNLNMQCLQQQVIL